MNSQSHSDTVCPGCEATGRFQKWKMQDWALKSPQITNQTSKDYLKKFSKIWSCWISPARKYQVAFLGREPLCASRPPRQQPWPSHAKGRARRLEKAGNRELDPNQGAPGDTGSESGPSTGMQPPAVVTPTITRSTLSLPTASNFPAYTTRGVTSAFGYNVEIQQCWIYAGILTLFTWSFCLQSYARIGKQITVAHFHMHFIHIWNFAFLCKIETQTNV